MPTGRGVLATRSFATVGRPRTPASHPIVPASTSPKGSYGRDRGPPRLGVSPPETSHSAGAGPNHTGTKPTANVVWTAAPASRRSPQRCPHRARRRLRCVEVVACSPEIRAGEPRDSPPHRRRGRHGHAERRHEDAVGEVPHGVLHGGIGSIGRTSVPAARIWAARQSLPLTPDGGPVPTRAPEPEVVADGPDASSELAGRSRDRRRRAEPGPLRDVARVAPASEPGPSGCSGCPGRPRRAPRRHRTSRRNPRDPSKR